MTLTQTRFFSTCDVRSDMISYWCRSETDGGDKFYFRWLRCGRKVPEQRRHYEAVIYVDITTATTQVDIRTLTPTYVHIVST